MNMNANENMSQFRLRAEDIPSHNDINNRDHNEHTRSDSCMDDEFTINTTNSEESGSSGSDGIVGETSESISSTVS